MNGKTRSSLLGLAGIYLIYLAYELFSDRDKTDTTMTGPARIVFITLFSLAGLALAVYAVLLWRRAGKDDKQAPDDPESLK